MADGPTTFLGTVNGVNFSVTAAFEPWSQGIDGLVVWQRARGSDWLASRLQSAYPELEFDKINAARITPGQPQAIKADLRESEVRTLILGWAPDSGPAGSEPTAAIPSTVVSVVSAAGGSGVAGLGLPIPDEVLISPTGLPALIGALRLLFQAATQKSLRSVLLIAENQQVFDLVTDAWEQRPAAVSFSGTAAQMVVDSAALGPELTPALLWLAALRRTMSNGRRDVATTLLAILSDGADDPDGLVQRFARNIGVSIAGSLPPGVTGPHLSIDSLLFEAGRSDVVTSAVEIGRRVNSDSVRQRHLLAAALLDPDEGEEIARGLGHPIEKVREFLRQAIRDVLPQEFPEVWDEILLLPSSASERGGPAEPTPEEDPDLHSPIAPDLVDANRSLSVEDDQLGLDPYVTMLATLIARRDTPMPLSVGLFGEWGSGKSTFMGLLRGKVGALSKRPEDGYLTDIEVIGFNAWHYSDASLWASLASTIFAHLARLDVSPTEDRRKLHASLTARRDERDRRQAEVDEAWARTARRERELTEARALAQERRRAAILGTALTKSVLTATKKLGLDGPEQSLELIKAELAGARGDVANLRAILRTNCGALLAGFSAAALALFAAAVLVPDRERHLLLGGGVGAVGLALAATATVLTRFRNGLKKVDQFVRDVRHKVDVELAAATAAQEGELAAARDHATRLQAELADADASVRDLETQLGNLAPPQQLHRFLRDRATSEDYTKELGLISTVRRDFERLIALMTDWRDHPGRGGSKLRPINRIVLYIDDLDRCSPGQVVDVLKAVHLLLALELFVVVVGVDPRWLLRSLRHEYSDTLDGSADAPQFPGESAWTAPAVDYLEKIFNIPFVLPPMDTAGFTRLVRKLASERAESIAPVDEVPPTDQGGDPPFRSTAALPDAEPDRSGEDAPADVAVGPPEAAAIVIEAGSEVAAIQTGRRSRPLGLTEPELVMLGSLGRLVETPRAAKRLLNLYQLLRSTRDLSTSSDFLNGGDGNFQAVAILLGMLTANPALLGALLWTPPSRGDVGGICHRGSGATWAEVCQGLVPRYDTGRSELGDLTVADQAGWTTMLTRLEPATALVTLPDLAPFQLWGPRIVRFSFVLSPFSPTEQPTTEGSR